MSRATSSTRTRAVRGVAGTQGGDPPLGQQIKLQGYTLVPLSLYFKKGRVKLELGLCKGKKLYDKRASAAARDARRDIDRALKTQR